jgi:hypothetical protein
MRRVSLVTLGLVVFCACASTSTRIAIQSRDWVGMFGQAEFEVQPGDELEVLYSKPCRGNRSETCWNVRNVKTGETGMMSKRHAKAVHRVYKASKAKSE